ncbi:hypothetical protein D2E25_0505 [Bifidobacterium goeldii]|uniref:DUF5067 domain-containing protein n=1 Tax=Bifidobacterium goeldii TaxID=2306975 RepID=A0A430FMZ9_9BIFI|nr:DUF5067 domain-containing protein [Bifidobacterium goeldii]RSX54197.1 hypothetical protein D2E25_0505 [Bifidobacterium goeldii]
MSNPNPAQQPSQRPVSQGEQHAAKPKKPLWKKWWFWLIIIIVVAALGSTAAPNSSSTDDANKSSTSSQSSSDATQKNNADTDASSTDGDTSKDKAAATGEQDMEGDVDSGNYHVKLVSLTKTGADYEGKPTAVLTYELTNNKSENSNYMDYMVSAFQNGRQLDTAIFTEAPEGYDANSALSKLQPGGTATVTQAYVLEDDSPVSIEVEGTVDFTDAKVTHTFTLQ